MGRQGGSEQISGFAPVGPASALLSSPLDQPSLMYTPHTSRYIRLPLLCSLVEGHDPTVSVGNRCQVPKMSFGFSPSDLITLINLTKKVYDGYRSAGNEYSDVTHTLKSFEVLLYHVDRRLDVLNIDGRRQQEIVEVVKGCQGALRELQAVARRF